MEATAINLATSPSMNNTQSKWNEKRKQLLERNQSVDKSAKANEFLVVLANPQADKL